MWWPCVSILRTGYPLLSRNRSPTTASHPITVPPITSFRHPETSLHGPSAPTSRLHTSGEDRRTPSPTRYSANGHRKWHTSGHRKWHTPDRPLRRERSDRSGGRLPPPSPRHPLQPPHAGHPPHAQTIPPTSLTISTPTTITTPIQPLHPSHPATPSRRNTSHTRSGRIGISICVTPKCASASTTAFAIAGGAPTVADSPTPFAPNG